MQILKRGISAFLLIVMLFSLIPSEFLPTAEAELYGNNSGVIQIGGVGSIHGGMLFKNNDYSYPVFRVMLSRDRKDYLNGTQERRDAVYNNYKVQYPDSKDMTSNTLFFWDSTLYNGAKRRSGVVGVTEYTYSGTDSINIRNTPEYTSLNIPLSTTTSYSTNNFKTKVMADVAAKKIVDIRGLSNYVWKNYLPTYEQALQNLSYIFADVGGGPVSFDVDNRINKFIGPYFTMESENLTREQKLDNSVGYGGLLADLYVVASADPNRAKVAGAYAAALNDYFANSNVEEKPVALIIDTGMPIVVDSTDFGIQKCGFVMPTIDYMELGMLATNDMAISNGETFLKGIGKSGAGSTRQMLRAMAQTSVDRKPRSTLYTGKGYGIVRIADGYGGWNTTNIRTNHPLGRLWSVPQFDHERVDIEDDSVARFNYAKWYGFLELLALDDSRNIKGFMVVGNHSADPDPTFSFTVETTGRSTPDRCEREASPTSPNKIKLKLIGDSGVIAGLEDSEEVMKIKSNIVRTTISYADGSSIESGTVTEVMNMDTLESQINRTYNYTETLGYLQGGTIELSDYEIMEDKFTRLDTGAFVVAYKYTIDLELTLNGNVYNFKSDEIVAKSDSGTLDTATVTIKSYGDTVILPEDIEITKPASTNTTEVIDPSENENLYELTQMIRRYEYTSEGAEFAETKSNTPLAEEYEVMGGIPSNEEIYFSVGGSEFKVAMILQYWMNEHSRDRTYTMHFDGTLCEYNNDEEGKGDRYHEWTVPAPAGASSSELKIGCTNVSGNGSGDWTVSASWTVTFSPKSCTAVGCHSSSISCSGWDMTPYETACEQRDEWLEILGDPATSTIKWTAASDGELREGYMTGSYSWPVPGPTHSSGSCTGCTCSGDDPCGQCHSGTPATPCSPVTVTYTVTAKMPPHQVCGPCCGHNLPDLYDTWRQGLVYDFVKISQIRLYKLDQGSADGFEELTGVDKIFANVMSGNPTYFMNIAQLTERGAMGDKIYPLDGSTGVFNDPKDLDSKGYTIFTNDLRRVSQSSRDGRIRYTLQEGHTPSVTINYQEQGNGSGGSFTLDYSKVAASNQHDDVIYTIGTRSKNCDGMATTDNFGKSSSNNVIPMETTGHENEWADGCLYTNILKTSNYSSYHDLNSYGYSYTPLELRDNDVRAIGMYPKWESSYYEDYNHHVVRPSSSGGTNGEDKTEYSDKADNKDTQTAEWQCFDKARRTKVVATVISDFLILQTSGGDQSIIYYEKPTEPTEAQEHFQKVKITEEEIFNNNPLSIFNGVSEVCSKQNNGNLKDERIVDYIVVGGYNGQYDKPTEKYKPYSLVTGEFLPFAGTGGTYDATKKTGTYNLWGGTQIKTILDSDPAKTISRPVRQATSQATSFKIYQDGIQILPTTANQLYEPKHGNVWYSQVIGYYSHDPNAYDAGAEMYGVWSKSNVNIGWLQKLAYYNKYMEDWGNSTGVSYETLYYQTPEGERDAPSINSIVVYTPVSTEYAMVLNQSDLNINGELISRDQRVNAIDYPDMNDLVNALKVCPLDPALCEYRYLDCKYHEPTTLAEFDFSSTYQTTEKQVEVNGNNVEVIDIPVTKKNTYKDGANWITTNLVTGVEYTLPTGFTVESNGKVGSGSYLSAKGTRWSIPLSSIGLSNSRTNKLEVSMDLTVEATGNNLMLVSFQNYGFVIDTTNLFGNFITRSSLRTDEIGAVQTMKGGSNLRNVHVTLVFGFNNIIDCTASINGVPTKVTSVTELREVWADVGDIRQLQAKNVALDLDNLLEDGPNEIARADIGSNINIGSWGSGNGYTANYYLDNLKIVLQGGTDEHNSTCYEKITVHATNKVHVHDDTCYAKEDIWTCDGELNANYQLGCNKAEKELICGLTESGSGVYNLVASDDDSGEGLEAYISYNLTRGQSVKIQMGGFSGRSGAATLTVSGPNGFKFVSGQQSYTGYFEGSGSYKYEFAVLTSGVYTFSTSNRTNDPYLGLYVRDGHRHVNTCYRTHVHSGTPGLDYPNGCYTKPTEHKHNNTVKVLTCNIPEGGDGKVYNYSYIGDVQSETLPAGRYKLEVWGAQGGGSQTNRYSNKGGLGGYSTGNINLNKDTTFYIVVGGAGEDSSTSSGGGGGATHIALRSGELSTLESYKSDILLVAGGGGGSGGNDGNGYGQGGSGGGTTGSNGSAISSDYGYGGSQTSGGSATRLGGNGSFGQGGQDPKYSLLYNGGYNGGGSGNVEEGGGGGGGYYGGGTPYSGSYGGGGGGGSGYVNTSKLTGTSMSNGVQSGNGCARITNLDHHHTDACYSTTQSTCSKIPAGSLICNGAPNTITDFNVHVHDATCLTNYTDLSATTYQYLGKVQTYVVPWTDDYTIEAYGPSASGSAKAGYAKGTVHLRAGTKLYIYVGGTDGFNNYTTDVRTISKPTGGNNNYEGAIISEIEKSSNASRMVIAGTSKANSSVNSITNYTLTNKSVLDKGNDGNGRVIITPANTRLNPSIYQQIVTGAMSPDEAKKYLGETLYNKIMKDSEKVLYTWSGWSTSNDKGFKALNQCSLTMNGNLVVKSTGGDPYFDVQLDNILYQAITQIKVYLNNPVSTRGQIFLQDATGYYNEPDSVWSNNVTVGANNQVMTFDLRGNNNFSGNFTRLRFDLGSTTGTMTVTKIEVIGYGSRVSGTGEASYINTEKVVAAAGTQWSFRYTGGVQSKPLEKGKYKLEVWGAQGGNLKDTGYTPYTGSTYGVGGKGGYSKGDLTLSNSDVLYIYIGGKGAGTTGGWNGGGLGSRAGAGGGGATHIALRSGELSSLSSYTSDILLVAGGGGGAQYGDGGAGGGANKVGEDAPKTVGGKSVNSFWGTSGKGGTLSSGYSFGLGGTSSAGSDGLYGGAGGGGYYGGKGAVSDVSRVDDYGGGGGSGYANTSKLTNISGNTGVCSGNGSAVITALEDIKTGEITYKFTPLKINYTNPFKGQEDVINANINTIPEKVDGDYNPIWLCHMQPYNKHVCETTDENGNIVTLCQTYTMLNCSEPHHKGEHYAGANEICWSACGNDDNHKNTHTEVVDHNTGETVQLAEFLQMDAAFTVYFPNIGDFAGQPNKLGLASCTIDRCYGYEDGMNTTDWTREKRVKFPFDVIFEGQVHMANTWIELDVPTEYFNFYILVSNNEIANGSVEFEVEAINCNTGVGVEVMPGIEYSASISTDYADALQKFLDGYIDLMAKDARATGYQVPVAVAKGNTGAAPRPFGTSGYEYFYVDKAKNEESKLRNTMEKVGDQIESDFEGGAASDAICNHMSPDDTGTVICPHTGSTTGINYTVKPLTSNDNKVRVDNKMRSDSLESLHGGYKHFYLDVIGRIGNFAIVDTEDFRFSNFFKMPIVSAYDAEGLADASNWLVEGLVLKVDDSIQNYYLGDQFDIRGNPASVPTRWLDTYGTESWMTGTLTDINDTSRDINNRNLLSQILTADVNNIEVLKGEELRFGYDVYTSIVTFGNYDNAWVQVVPKYYALKVNDEDLTELYPTMPAKYNVAKGTYIPIDVYIDKDGLFAPINVFGNAGDGDSNKNNIELYDYVFNLDWTAESNRRNYTIEEKARTLAVCEEFKQIIYDIPEDDDAEGNANSEFNVTDYEIKEVNEWKKPQGKDNLLGTAQYIVMGPEHRTFIGDRNSYGYNVYTSQAGTTDFKTDKNPGSVINDILFKKNVQRWHGKIGLPSSSVFVPTGEEVTNDSINWLMNDNFVIVCTAEIIAVGDIWSIHYSQPWFKTMNIDGVTFGTSTHYPGHRVENANGESVPCPDCLPPIIAVYSSANSSIDDIEIIGSY